MRFNLPTLGSLPDRQLRKSLIEMVLAVNSSLPDRQLRKQFEMTHDRYWRSLPDRQLRNCKVLPNDLI